MSSSSWSSKTNRGVFNSDQARASDQLIEVHHKQCESGDQARASDQLIEVEHRGSDLPEFMCACRIPASVQKSTTERNYGQRFISCGHQKRVCYTWLWEDQLKKYAVDVSEYCHSSTIDALQEQISCCKSDLYTAHREIFQLKSEVESKAADLDTVK